MHPTDATAFDKLLSGVFEIFNRKAPSPEARAVWWRILRSFDLAAVSQALGTYARTHTDFPPTPAAILELLGHGNGDNRPTADEAWAVALSARDEADTVVWTAETAQAFAAARRVLDMGDEVGARMAFKGAYDRLVTTARRESRAPVFQVSLGWDQERRATTLESAVNAGLLPAPAAAALLPPPADTEPTDVDATAQLARLRQMLVDIKPQSTQERTNAGARTRHAELLAKHDAKLADYQTTQGVSA